ncbi:MAG: hypothetical protein WBV46_12455 [Terriglobales bacterium]
MSAKQTVMIACRALAVYCLVWFLADFAYLPLNVYTLYHHVETVSAMAPPYWRNYYLLELSARLLRMIGLFFAVQWFYRAGPSIEKYFLSPSDEELDRGTKSMHSAL